MPTSKPTPESTPATPRDRLLPTHPTHRRSRPTSRGGQPGHNGQTRELVPPDQVHAMVLDEFGLKPLTPPMPHDLYDVISERYARGSILVTSNRVPGELVSFPRPQVPHIARFLV
jgi:hypothetical protein